MTVRRRQNVDASMRFIMCADFLNGNHNINRVRSCVTHYAKILEISGSRLYLECRSNTKGNYCSEYILKRGHMSHAVKQEELYHILSLMTVFNHGLDCRPIDFVQNQKIFTLN